eukprot:TRINITY_DN771_c1_g1_i1.p2 TRINITY_DN771_c1_g1~~TRINITY_DN771_c1_g1_i1.p2  ORF type:complete len:303 (+),score=123.98 TRINITY_DN771_c1_g1_i1:83-991(+)
MNFTQLATAALVGGRLRCGARAAARAGAQRRGFAATRPCFGRKDAGGGNGAKEELEKKLASMKDSVNHTLARSDAYYKAKSKVDEVWRTIDLKLAQYGITSGDEAGTDMNLLRYLISAMLIMYVLYFIAPPGMKHFLVNNVMLTTENYTRVYPFLTSLLLPTDFLSMLISSLILYSIAPPLLFTLGRQRFWAAFFGGGLTANALFVMLEGRRDSGWMRHLSATSGPSAGCTSLIALSCLLRPQQTVMLFFIPVQSLHLAYLVVGLDVFRLLGAMNGGRAEHTGGALFGAGYWYTQLGGKAAL